MGVSREGRLLLVGLVLFVGEGGDGLGWGGCWWISVVWIGLVRGWELGSWREVGR